jgi:flavin-dependent dehydrogenase
MKDQKKYEVVILGGGLAGLTLALQLKLSKPCLSILVLEKRKGDASIAKHKVGESTAELGSFYLREVLQLKAYLNKYQLPKYGFRLFFSQEHRDNIARRVELGSRIQNPIPAHQIDRGIFENEMVRRLSAKGVEVRLGATIKNVELSKGGHEIRYEKIGSEYSLDATWVIDSTGRSSLLKRKLGLSKNLDHFVNAAWFRLGSDIDINDWSDDEAWCNWVDPGRRRLSTNHLMGEGYWVWIIPLISGNTSIGIVADPDFHPFEQFNTFEKAMKWLAINEPLAAKMLGKHKKELVDFKVMKHFSHDTKQLYSTNRWGLTGDAGAFLDPFYSPGADFLALNNSWLTELIIRDCNGENIALRTMIYEHAHRQLIDGWILLYKSMYGLFGKTQIMLVKVVWDWASYWGIPSLMFMNNGYTIIDVLKQYSATTDSIGQRFSLLNGQMQKLFLEWSNYDMDPCSDRQINILGLDCLYQFHRGLEKRYNPEDLIKKVDSNVKILEQVAAGILRLVFTHLKKTSLDMKIDPYRMSLQDTRDELLEKSKGVHAFEVIESIKSDLAKVWLISVKTKSEEYV